MSSSYSGARTAHASITLPDNGESRNVASVNVALEALADRTAFLADELQVYATDADGSVAITKRRTSIQLGAGGMATFNGDRTLSFTGSPVAGDEVEVFLHPDEDTYGVTVVGVYLNNSLIGGPPGLAPGASRYARFIYAGGGGGGWLHVGSGRPQPRSVAQLGAGTLAWKCPDDVTTIDVVACGGGGGGGGGAGGNTSANLQGGGGGGGGGAGLVRRESIAVTAGVTYELVTGAGGTAGSAGALDANGTSGSNGSQTVFQVSGGAVLARWAGGHGGKGGILSANGPARYTGGGGPLAIDKASPTTQVAMNRRPEAAGSLAPAGYGGCGFVSANDPDTAPAAGDTYGTTGGGSPGGPRGLTGTRAGSGGSAGGGGGCGGGGAGSGWGLAAGGTGGNGGNGSQNPGTSTVGTVGTAGGYGCGGGGGGGGGGSDYSGGLVGGSAGGAGGDGAGLIIWTRG